MKFLRNWQSQLLYQSLCSKSKAFEKIVLVLILVYAFVYIPKPPTNIGIMSKNSNFWLYQVGFITRALYCISFLEVSNEVTHVQPKIVVSWPKLNICIWFWYVNKSTHQDNDQNYFFNGLTFTT